MEVILKAPEGCTGCSHEGVEYEVDGDGLVMVPNDAVAPLLEHGFIVHKAAPVTGKKSK